MPRKHLIRTSEFPYHICARSNNKDWFYLPIKQVWDIFIDKLAQTQQKFDLDIYCFVLMDNHFHLFLRTPGADIDKAMHNLIHKMSLEIGKRSGRINKIFGGRYRRSIVNKDSYQLNVTRYIYQNPLRAGLCSKIEDYPFHSLSTAIKYSKLRDQSLSVGDLEFSSLEEKLNWLNDNIENDDILSIRSGLLKTTFSPVSRRSY